MYYCKVCNLEFDRKNNLVRHYKSIIHKDNLKGDQKKLICSCGKEFAYQKNYSRHIKTCDQFIPLKPSTSTSTTLKNQNQNQKNIMNNTGTFNNSVVMMGDYNTLTKIEKLNLMLNETNMIDLETFILNYKNNPKYQLTANESKTLMENYQFEGYKSLGFDLPYYIRDKYQKQLKDIKGIDLKKEEVILPFISTDGGARSYLKKEPIDWKREKDIADIKRLIVITSDQIYKHHNQYLSLSNFQMNLIAKTVVQTSRYDDEKLTHPEYQLKNLKIKS
jgi:hypothetical protein